MAGLFDSILARSGRPDWMPTTDAAFPELNPAPAEEDSTWKLPATLLPPSMRKGKHASKPVLDAGEEAAPGVDATNPGIQTALGNPQAPQMPAIFEQAGMLPSLNPNTPIGRTETEKALQPDAPALRVPMPMGRPAGAPPPPPVDPMTTDIAGGIPPGNGSQGTDVGARSRAPMQLAPAIPPEAAAPAAVPDSPWSLPSILDRVRTTLGNNSNTLLALGAGFAGAPNIGQGISRAAAAAIPARAADIKQTLDIQSRGYGTKALIDAGVPVQQAIAAQGDPELRKALIKSYIEDRGQEIQMIKTKDPWGGETEVPYIKNKYPKPGEPVLTPAFKDDQGNAAPVPGTGTPNGTAIYAPGVTQATFDHTKVGDEYLGQFSPEVQASAKAYLAGRSLPTGRQLPVQMIKQAAMKYGDDIGMPGDDTSISQRKQWANSLGDIKSGVGLSSKGFKQGLEHFVALSDNLVKMNLSNGFGLEPIAGAINSAKNLTSEQQKLVHKSDVIGQALSREMGNLFAKNGGGVHEAAETKKAVSNATMSSKAAAGSLEAIDELMQGGLKTLEQRRDELFPNGNAPKGSQFLGPDQEKALERIRHNIAILKGEKTAAAEAPAGGYPPPPGKYEFRDGQLVRVQ